MEITENCVKDGNNYLYTKDNKRLKLYTPDINNYIEISFSVNGNKEPCIGKIVISRDCSEDGLGQGCFCLTIRTIKCSK